MLLFRHTPSAQAKQSAVVSSGEMLNAPRRGGTKIATPQENAINDRERPYPARAMMSLLAKIARKHASARGPDPRAAVKTVGMGLAGGTGFFSFRAIVLGVRGECEDRRFVAWRRWLRSSIFFWHCYVKWRDAGGWWYMYLSRRGVNEIRARAREFVS